MPMIGIAMLCAAAALITAPVDRSALGRVVGEGGVAEKSATTTVVDRHAVATCFDMMAACLAGGLSAGAAARAVSTMAPPDVSTALRTTADLLGLGADPDDAWKAVGALPEVEALARMARRSSRSGASFADAVVELADSERASAEDAAAAEAERAGVLVSGPLGLCFLPAFVCLGIVPVVIGLASSVLGGGVL
ncbi:type II secretion system F family protein [Rhodococcus sp. 114MFTsu3.1]|uniref:type II secretion system F family protein n=1 Tax=Rhodococcus sp. 114MFTsu3.1 TaxID=1172184 RepID=UPI0003739DB6|nr:type II secretion system F family protein [Rhodococcus sp. 114MFTsu3.1]